MRGAFVGSLLAACLFLVPLRARADGPYEGQWRAGAMRIDVAIESWGADCGPRPQSTTSSGGRTFQVTQSGDDLTFSGSPQRSTRTCWSENTSVRRVSSSYQSGTWTIVCRTPADDPRGEVGTYTLRASGSDRLEFRDVSRYDWTLNDSRCVASITATQTFERVSAAPTPDPTTRPSTPSTPAQPAEPACTAGTPARVVLRPAATDLEPGGRICFTARVTDAAGCTVRGRSPRLELRAPAGATGSLQSGCFQAAPSAAEGEGEFTIVARDGTFEAEARVRVRTPDLSDLIARRGESSSAAFDDDEETVAEEAARVAARSEATRREPIGWLLVVVALGAGLLVLGLLLRGRRRPARAVAQEDVVARPAPAPSPDAIAEPVLPPTIASEVPMICPTCRRGHPAGATRCSTDGTLLVPYAEFAAGSGSATAAKVCPTCGERYPATTRFCGKDGATLSDA